MQEYSKLYIDLEAIRHNYNAVLKYLPENTAIMPMIKANGYGLGIAEMGKFYTTLGAPILGVSWIDEAFFLRDEGIQIPLFSLSCPRGCFLRAAQLGIELSINSLDEIHWMNEELSGSSETLFVHIHIDVGMHRLGLPEKECFKALKEISKSPHLRLNGLMSHFSSSSMEKFDSISQTQKKLFSTFCAQISPSPKWMHMGSSNSVKKFPQPECNLVRLGPILFGIDHTPSLPLRPALSLYATVISTHQVQEGEHVGYDGYYIERKEKARVAVISIGYHDGLHLEFSGKGYVWLNGKPAPYVGRICMDFMTVDITDIPDVQVGDRVEIFGPNIPLSMLAKWGFGAYRQLIACLGPRIKRVYHQKEENHEQLKKTLSNTL
jgi:Alr-MurF fusion protein